MDTAVEGPDVSVDLLKFSRANEPWDSAEFQIWWNEVQNSSSLKIRESVDATDWQYLMQILRHCDVSRIQVLVINLPRRCFASNPENGTVLSQLDSIEEESQLGIVLYRRFYGLRTLRILATHPNVLHRGLGGESLVKAAKLGQLKSLRTFSLPAAAFIYESMFDGMSAPFPELTSLAVSWKMQSNYNAEEEIFSKGYFKSLHSLELSEFPPGSWEYFMGAIESGHLPNVTSLRISNSPISEKLADFVSTECKEKWFRSLENLVLDGCAIDSALRSQENILKVRAWIRQLDPVRKRTQFALKRLDLRNNELNSTAVAVLILLAKRDQLPHLQDLNLSQNKGLDDRSFSLVELIKNTGSKSLVPNLRNLKWENNHFLESAVEAIVQAYYTDKSLTTEIHLSWLGVKDLSLRTKLKEYRERNARLAGLVEKLNEDTTVPSSSHHVSHDVWDSIPLTSAKVFLCGYPEVGKTRLRKTLLRQVGKKTKFVWETRPRIFKQPRTRGIEISKVGEKKDKNGKNVTLVMWDLAGQQEYHVLHGTFLADLGFEGGKATTFVLVFKAPFEADVEPKLLYWLRFVASSSLRHVKRHVVIVLNCFYGRRCPDSELRLWAALIKEFANMFSDLLVIHPVPFLVDVRVAASVKQLRDHLFDHAQTLLQDVRVPGICFDVQEGLRGWSEGGSSNPLPILSWQTFEAWWKLTQRGNHFSTEALKTASSYLHEIGEIIYFEEKVVSEPSVDRRSVLVPNPEWFCRRVVGELLLPKEMLEGGSAVKAAADGSISVVMFKAFFEHLLDEGTHTDDVISMLELVGLCYRKGKEKIIVPALIHEDDYQSITSWDGKGFEWVTGRALTIADKGRNVIPMTLFRRLQVELALHPNFGGRGDSDYRAGKSFSSFMVGELTVLIQFDVDHSNPYDNRIDILVKSLARVTKREPKDFRVAQVKCVCDVMQRLEDLCVTCCPGITYDIMVIEPSSAANRIDRMSERKLMALREIKRLLVEGKEYLSWRTFLHHMKLKDCLSDGELNEILPSQASTENAKSVLESSEVAEASSHSLEDTVEQENYDDCKEDALTMGLVTMESLEILEGCNTEDSCDFNKPRMKRAVVEDHVDRILYAIQDVKQTVREGVLLTRQHVDMRNKQVVMAIAHKQAVLVRCIQAQQSFSIQEKERSVPRYMFLSKKQGHSRVWISLREAFHSTFHLHLLCEAHFENGFLHEVDPQEGIRLKKPKKWLVKVSPWLRRSLQVAIMVGKTVGNVYLPGVFNLIPDLNVGSEQGSLAKAVDSAATMLVEEDGRVEQNQCGTAAQPVNLFERLIAEEVIRDVIREVGHVQFTKKIRLRRVLLRAAEQPEAGSSQQTEGSVLWICEECYKRYGNRVTNV